MFGLVYTLSGTGKGMTKSMTGSFYLTETVTLPVALASGDRVTATVDLSAYVNVPTGQAIAIESVDFITQIGADFGGPISQVAAADSSLGTMLVDLNPGNAFVRADNHSLVASQRIDIDQSANLSTQSQDLYPDNFGPSSLSEAFLVVNDTLYLVAGIDGSATVDQVSVSARIRCRVVKLSTKDWMAIAIQSTASE
jgi:hypothetical protein